MLKNTKNILKIVEKESDEYRSKLLDDLYERFSLLGAYYTTDGDAC